MAQAQEAWKRGKVADALLMGVAAAFPSVARGCLMGKVRNMGIDEVLVDWTGGFMIDHLVTMSVGSRGGEA